MPVLPPPLPPEVLADHPAEGQVASRLDLGRVLCDALENDVTIWNHLDESDKARYQYAAVRLINEIRGEGRVRSRGSSPLSSLEDTDRTWPPPSMGVCALRVLEARLGQEELPKGSNQGDIVRWACERWLSAAEFKKAYEDDGIMWCAGAVCSAFVEAGSQEIMEVASLSCDTLWKRLTHDRPDRKVKHGHEQPGDLYFLGSVGDLKHVGLVVEPGEMLKTISGNSGDGVRYGHVRRDRVMWFCRLVA